MGVSPGWDTPISYQRTAEPVVAEEPQQAFDRELNRVADRLRVLGSRLAAHPDGPIVRIRTDLQRLADLAAGAEGLPRRELPALDPHALADQMLVLGHDLITAGDPGALVDGTELLQELRRML